MLPDDVQVVSVDDHVIEHRTVWQDRLPAKYRDAGPRSERTEHGHDVWTFEGRAYPTIGLNAVAGKPPEQYNVDPLRYEDMLDGCYDIAARIVDMDVDGVHAQLCFPSFPGFAGSTFFAADDKALANACVSAWNDFILDEWCSYAPGRQIPLALVPYWDIDATVAEATRTIARGSKAISFIEAPHSVGLPSFHSDHWDPLFAVLAEAGVPLCLHFGSGGPPPVAPGGPSTALIAMYGLNSVQCTVELLNSRIFERFAGLRIAMSEGGIGWIPYVVERCEYVISRHQFHAGMHDAKRPADIFREHIFGCFIADDAGLANLERIGVDNVMFESDYPHSDSNWPHSRTRLAASLANVPDDLARKVAEDNARRLFNFPRVDAAMTR
jgi:predicted TIM-barrel fold metal-dependent hydrolase